MSDQFQVRQTELQQEPDHRLEASRAQTHAEIGTPCWPQGWLVCVVTLLAYVQSIAFGFLVLDDTAFIIRNPRVHSWGWIPSYFIGSSDPSLPILGFYRPFPAIWILLRYEFFGLHPWLWHLSSLALYALGVWLFWRLAWELSQENLPALLAAIIYGLHPLHVEGVVWLSGSTMELLLNVFFMGAFLAYLKWRKQPSVGWLCGCGVLTLCALLSKETALALPLLIVAHSWIFRQPPIGSENQGRQRAILAGTMVTTVGVYFLLRTLAIHTVVTSRPLHSWAEIVRTAPLLFVTYLRQAVWPAHLGMWHDTQEVQSMTEPAFYLPLIFVILYLVLMIWAVVRKPLVGFLMLWWAVALAVPVAGLRIFPASDIIHDRFSFVALGGLSLLAGVALRRLPAAGPSFFGFPASQATAVAGLVVLLGTLTAIQVNAWRDDMAVYTQAVSVSPKSVRPRILLANEFLKRGDYSHALALDREALALDPNQWETLFAYGVTLSATGDRLQASQVLARGIDLAPAQTILYYALAKDLADMGRFDDAAAVLQRGIAAVQDPQNLQRTLAGVRALQNRSRQPHQP